MPRTLIAEIDLQAIVEEGEEVTLLEAEIASAVCADVVTDSSQLALLIKFRS